MSALPLLLALLATAPDRPEHFKLVLSPLVSHSGPSCPTPTQTARLESEITDALRQAGFAVSRYQAKDPQNEVFVSLEIVSGQFCQLSVVATRVPSKQEVLRWASSIGPQLATEFATKLQEALLQWGTFSVEAQGVWDETALQVLAAMFEAAGADVLTSTLGRAGRATMTAQCPAGTSTLRGPLLDRSGLAFKTMGRAFSAMNIAELSDDAFTITLFPILPINSGTVVTSPDALLESDFTDALRRVGIRVYPETPPWPGRTSKPKPPPCDCLRQFCTASGRCPDLSQANIMVEVLRSKGQVSVVATRVPSRREVLRWASAPSPQLATEFATKFLEALLLSAGKFSVEARGVRSEAALQVLVNVFDEALRAEGGKILTSKLGTRGRATLEGRLDSKCSLGRNCHARTTTLLLRLPHVDAVSLARKSRTNPIVGLMLPHSRNADQGSAFETMSSAFSSMAIDEVSDDTLTITMSPK